MTTKKRASWLRLVVIVSAFGSTAALPPISPQDRAALDRTLGVKGIYIEEESAYAFSFLRTDISVQVGGQRLSPAQAPRSWMTFAPSMYQRGVMNGEIIALEDEINRVMSAALNAGLEVTGLGASLLFERPRLLTLNVWSEGSFQDLARALRRTLDCARDGDAHVHRHLRDQRSSVRAGRGDREPGRTPAAAQGLASPRFHGDLHPQAHRDGAPRTDLHQRVEAGSRARPGEGAAVRARRRGWRG